MKNLVSLIVFALVFLGLGAMALMAAPGGADLVAEFNPSETAAQAPITNAASATSKWNAIAVPLDVGSLTADGVKTYIESFCDPACPGAVEKVSKWDPVNQQWITRGTSIIPVDFTVYPGQALFISVSSAASDLVNGSFAWTGSVPPECPAAGCIQYGISAGLPELTSTGWNFLMVPLDKEDIGTADELKLDIDPSGNATKVSKWDAANQQWITRGSGIIPANFVIQIGYPYFVFSQGSGTSTWPTSWP